MSNFRGLLRLAACAFLVCCSGNTEELLLSLQVNVNNIVADGKSEAKFTVFEGNADVTSDAVINEAGTDNALAGSLFSTTQPGEYFFYATYDGQKTDTVKVVAEPVVVSKFVRNVCLMEFTDAECAFCPAASMYIDASILPKYDYVHLMAFHEKDQWKSDQFPALFTKFNLTSTPSASVDMRGGISLDQGNRDALKSAITQSISEYPAHCAIALSSEPDEHGNVNIVVKLYSERTSEYYLAVYIVEDGIRGPQLNGSITDKLYYHQFVVRKMISATIYGDPLGRISAGEENINEYSVSCDSEWNLSNTYVYALAIDSAGYVNNMQVCRIGGKTDYEYIK